MTTPETTSSYPPEVVIWVSNPRDGDSEAGKMVTFMEVVLEGRMSCSRTLQMLNRRKGVKGEERT